MPTARLYVYYRLPAACLADALAPLHAATAALCRARPGLRCELLRRPGAPQGEVTLMECWQHPAGIDAVTASAIAAALEGALAHALGTAPARHVEWFEPLDTPTG